LGQTWFLAFLDFGLDILTNFPKLFEMDSQDSISPVTKRFKLSSGDEDDYDQLHGKASFDCKVLAYLPSIALFWCLKCTNLYHHDALN
jgi:hypothetical protein